MKTAFSSGFWRVERAGYICNGAKIRFARYLTNKTSEYNGT